MTIKNNTITKIEGGEEADALTRFLASMKERLGEGVYGFNRMHSGVHPHAAVGPHQCPSNLYRRVIDHSHSSNLHFHVGAPMPTPEYQYWMHITADIRTATLRVGENLVHDRGRLISLDDPAVLAVAAKYPGRPGLEPMPRSY